MITCETYLSICIRTYANNRRICFDRKIAGRNLQYYTYAYWSIGTAAKMAAIAGEMIYENQVY